MPKRCALGCDYNSNLLYHRFPHPINHQDQFKLWVHIAGGKLVTVRDAEKYKKRVICSKHFTEEDKNRNNRLNALAVPALLLPIPFDVSDMHKLSLSNEFAISVTLRLRRFLEKNIITAESVVIPEDFEINDVSEQEDADVFDSVPETNDEATMTEFVCVQPSSSNEIIPAMLDELPETIYTPSMAPKVVAIENSTAKKRNGVSSSHLNLMDSEHNYHTNVEERLKDDTVVKNLDGEFKSMKGQIRRLQSEVISLRRRCIFLKSKLSRKAEVMRRSSLLQRLTKDMTPAAKIFTRMQYAHTKKKPAGRRFTDQEKVLSLALYTSSPDGYALWSSCFTLPSIKSIKNFQ